MKHTILLVVTFSLLAASILAEENDAKKRSRGFLEDPPVYVVSEPDMPLAGFGAFVPKTGEVLPAIESTTFESSEWRQDDVVVQPNLFVKFNTLRFGALYGLRSDWAVMAAVPRTRVLLGSEIGTQPATVTNTNFGETVLAAKKVLWQCTERSRLVGAFGIELPTGTDDVHFDQNNSSTDAYYPTDPGRLPISWQPSAGSVNGLFGLSWARYVGRMSYAAMAVVKIHGRGFADSKIGNIGLISGCATYGLSRWAAASLGLTLRKQSDDHYPGVTPPVTSQLALAGTTTHGTTLYVDPSLRFLVANRLVIGVDVRYPVVKPKDGIVPAVRVDAIFYPSW